MGRLPRKDQFSTRLYFFCHISFIELKPFDTHKATVILHQGLKYFSATSNANGSCINNFSEEGSCFVRNKFGNFFHLSSIFIAKRKIKKSVGNSLQIDFFKKVSSFGSDALDELEWVIKGFIFCCCGFAAHQFTGLRIIIVCESVCMFFANTFVVLLNCA